MTNAKSERMTRLLGGACAGTAAVLLLSYCGFRLHFNLSTADSIDLLIVVIVALKFGFWEATASSLVAVASLAYFFAPPILSFRVNDPDNWVALASFEITALIVSRLSNQLRKQTRQACVQRHNSTRLYELSRSILVLKRNEPAGPQIASLIKKEIGAEAVAIFDGDGAKVYTADDCVEEEVEMARNAYFKETNRDQERPRTWQRVLRISTKPIGALVLRGPDLTPLMVDAVASLVTAALERARSFEKESRAEAARQTEELRTTVLDGLAHAFKTPLTVIKSSASGLLEMNHLEPPQRELAELIDQHASLLSALTTHLLRMARLDSAEIQIHPEELEVAELVDEIVVDCRAQVNQHPIEVDIPDTALTVFADRQLLKLTIAEFVINAAKYSSDECAIRLAGKQEDGRVLISVHNEGSVVDIEDRERIFERFYRSPASRDYAAGSGIGLSVAKKTADAHQGNTWVSSDAESGTTFFLALPAETRRHHESIARQSSTRR